MAHYQSGLRTRPSPRCSSPTTFRDHLPKRGRDESARDAAHDLWTYLGIRLTGEQPEAASAVGDIWLYESKIAELGLDVDVSVRRETCFALLSPEMQEFARKLYADEDLRLEFIFKPATSPPARSLL